MYLYIFFQIIYLFLIIFNFIVNEYIDILTIGPATMSILYIFMNKTKESNVYLILSLIFSLSGDIFFILLNKPVLGIASFIIVQMCYLYFLKGKSNKISLIVLLNFLICLLLDKKILIIEAILYATIFLINIILTIKNIKVKKTSFLFLVALISLLICDTNIAIIKKINLPEYLDIICNCIEWIFYTLNLIIITLLTTKSELSR